MSIRSARCYGTLVMVAVGIVACVDAAAAQDAAHLVRCVEVFSTIVCIIRIPKSTLLNVFSP